MYPGRASAILPPGRKNLSNLLDIKDRFERIFDDDTNDGNVLVVANVEIKAVRV